MFRPLHSCWLPRSSSQYLLLSPHVCGSPRPAAYCMLPHQLHASCCTPGIAACCRLHSFCLHKRRRYLRRLSALLRCFVQIGFMGPAFFLTQLSKVTTAGQAVGCMMACQGLDAFSQSGLYSNHQVSFQSVSWPRSTGLSSALESAQPLPAAVSCGLRCGLRSCCSDTIVASSREGCTGRGYLFTMVQVKGSQWG